MREGFFSIKRAGSTPGREILAGLTTFVTVAYIIVVNPAILAKAGIPIEASMTATILTAAIGSILMGLIANRPFAVAPYMGENAFVAYTVVGVFGYSWQTALGAILISGIVFVLLTISGLRSSLAQAIPTSLKHSFAVGIGLFLAFIGFSDIGVVAPGVPGAPLTLGNLMAPVTLLGIGTLFLMALLLLKKVPGAIMIAIGSATAVSFLTGLSDVPSQFVSLPPSLTPVFLAFDLKAALALGFINVVLVVFVMDFVDTMGSLIALSARAGLLDRDGNLPEIERPMLVDAISTVVAALLGTTTAGIYIESAAGIETGGRTGLVAIVCGLMFLTALFFAPILTSVPPAAYGPALIVVGTLMMASALHIPYDKFEELFPAFLVIALMSFTFNIGIGMNAGFLAFPLFMVAAGRSREVKPGMWILFGLAALLFAVYPY